jgi:hypothetical protein
MKLNRKQKTALNVIRGTRGRFFGLKTTQGETLNAQFRGETESYIQIFDRNNGNVRRFAKTSLDKVSFGK